MDRIWTWTFEWVLEWKQTDWLGVPHLQDKYTEADVRFCTEHVIWVKRLLCVTWSHWTWNLLQETFLNLTHFMSLSGNQAASHCHEETSQIKKKKKEKKIIFKIAKILHEGKIRSYLKKKFFFKKHSNFSKRSAFLTFLMHFLWQVH